MNAIQIIKQNAKMWLGPKYSNKEYEIFKEGIEPFANRCIKEILEANNDEKKAPRTGFPVPTEKEKKEFEEMLKEIEENERHGGKLNKDYKRNTEVWYIEKPLEPFKYYHPKSIIEYRHDLQKQIDKSFFHCPIHKKTKLTKFRSKKGNGQVCTKCNPKLIK